MTALRLADHPRSFRPYPGFLARSLEARDTEPGVEGEAEAERGEEQGEEAIWGGAELSPGVEISFELDWNSDDVQLEEDKEAMQEDTVLDIPISPSPTPSSTCFIPILSPLYRRPRRCSIENITRRRKRRMSAPMAYERGQREGLRRVVSATERFDHKAEEGLAVFVVTSPPHLDESFEGLQAGHATPVVMLPSSPTSPAEANLHYSHGWRASYRSASSRYSNTTATVSPTDHFHFDLDGEGTLLVDGAGSTCTYGKDDNEDERRVLGCRVQESETGTSSISSVSYSTLAPPPTVTTTHSPTSDTDIRIPHPLPTPTSPTLPPSPTTTPSTPREYLDLDSPRPLTPGDAPFSLIIKGTPTSFLAPPPRTHSPKGPLGSSTARPTPSISSNQQGPLLPPPPPPTALLPPLPISFVSPKRSAGEVADRFGSPASSLSSLPSSSVASGEAASPPEEQQESMSLDQHASGRQWDNDALDSFTSPPSLQHRQHHKTPSVPCSTRTTSTISGTPIETPQTGYTFSQAHKRYSKFTAFSGASSSNSSLYSSDSDSARDSHRQYRVTGHPDISTVFEEEGSVDVHLEKEQGRQLRHQTSQATFTNPHVESRHNRTGTVSSAASGRSAKSNHPFASTIIRAPSPPNNLRVTSPALPGSQSLPNIAAMARVPHAPAHQVALAEESHDDDEKCPICVESLSFTFRLPGEKPHIVPECGHALHEECFVTVYGEVPQHGSKRNIGLCGVCRQKMRIVEGGGERKRSKGRKLEMLTGANGTTPSLRNVPSIPSLSSHLRSPLQAVDLRGDDPLEAMGLATSNSSRSFLSDMQPRVVIPTISIRSEFPSIAPAKKSKTTTAIVTIEVPPAPERGRYSGRPTGGILQSPPMDDPNSPRLPPSPNSSGSDERLVSPTSRHVGFLPPPSASSFSHVESELRTRLIDFKTSGLENLGGLRLYDLIAVRKGAMLKEFLMYLYSDALICISEEKQNAFQKIFSSNSSMKSHDTRSTAGTGTGKSLKLRGRIYIKHIKKLVDSSLPNELSLTILMENESMESFILTFKDRASHETWKSTFQRVLDEAKGTHAHVAPGGNSANKVAKLMGAGAPPPAPRSAKGMSPGLPSSASLGNGYGHSFGDFETPSTSAFSPRFHEPSPGDLVASAPLAPTHTPIDFIVVLSLPTTPTGPQLPLKVRLMRQSLAFVLALLGSKDRVSLVACEIGTSVRRTPFLNPTRYDSRRRLEEFVETLGSGQCEDEFEVEAQPDERQDVVTAVNVALDVVLQRKLKNPVTGMILISDTSEVVKRAQMDLVTARLDAANIPVHSVGYGKSHDPSPLWMMSNHTHGTYTFVREWYHLRDTLAGIIGGLMAVALTNMKLHLSTSEHEFKITKVTGTTSATVASNGKTVDIELRELRFGEVREILVDVELERDESRYSGGGSESSGSGEGAAARAGPRKPPSLSTGMDSLTVSDSTNALRDMVYEEGMVDEIPVIEVDCSFHDPAINRTVSRLAHPVLLTLAILPPHFPSTSSPTADPTIVRRRMELLASDMITRALLLISRRNFKQAGTLLGETRRIVQTMADGIRGHAMNGQRQSARTKREIASVRAVEQMENVVGDMDILCEALEEQPELFERDHRNYASQQAIVLRSQSSWTTRTGTESWYATEEVRRVVQLSGEWSTRG